MAASDAVSETRRDSFADPPRRAVLDRYRLGPEDLVGAGGEADVFALDDERVLRLHRNADPSSAAGYIRRIAALYDALDRDAVPFRLPEVLDGLRCAAAG
jgi:hypothetical protein